MKKLKNTLGFLISVMTSSLTQIIINMYDPYLMILLIQLTYSGNPIKSEWCDKMNQCLYR